MHGNLSAPVGAATSTGPEAGIHSVPDAGANPASGTDDWFYDAAVTVYGPKETGLHLHLATGWPRTSCYAFVARDPEQRRKLSVEFLRILFRSEHGKPFRDAFMLDCEAAWWLEECRAASVGRGVMRIVSSIP